MGIDITFDEAAQAATTAVDDGKAAVLKNIGLIMRNIQEAVGNPLVTADNAKAITEGLVAYTAQGAGALLRQAGQPQQQGGQQALGAGNTTSQQPDSQDELNRVKAELERSRADLADLNWIIQRLRQERLLGHFPNDDKNLANDEINALLAVVNEGKAAVAKLDEQPKQPTAVDPGLKDRNQKMLNDITNVAKLVNSLEHVIVNEGKYEEHGVRHKTRVFALPEKLGNKPTDVVLEGQFNSIRSIVDPYLPRQQ